jgi:hypothetical protein
MILCGVGICGGLWYWLMVIKQRKTWYVNMYEQKADGSLQLVKKDILIRKKVLGGKYLLYTFKNEKMDALPPSWESVYRVGRKEYVDYLRIDNEYLPLMQKLSGFENINVGDRKKFAEDYSRVMQDVKRSTPKDVDNRYMYIPIHRSLHANIEFKPVEYDINMMRISAIDIRDKIYADRKAFWETYGSIIAIGAVVVLIIVVLYMSYGYSTDIINAGYARADSTISLVSQVASQLGGTPPAS